MISLIIYPNKNSESGQWEAMWEAGSLERPSVINRLLGASSAPLRACGRDWAWPYLDSDCEAPWKVKQVIFLLITHFHRIILGTICWKNITQHL